MKIIHYALFASSQSLLHFLHERGVDPDTVYLNDAKFMKRVFKILVSPLPLIKATGVDLRVPPLNDPGPVLQVRLR